MKVQRAVLRESSPVWSAMLDEQGPWSEAGQVIVEMKDDSVAGMEVWFRRLHHATARYDISISQIWDALAAADKYGLKIIKLRGWFSVWWKVNALRMFSRHSMI